MPTGHALSISHQARYMVYQLVGRFMENPWRGITSRTGSSERRESEPATPSFLQAKGWRTLSACRQLHCASDPLNLCCFALFTHMHRTALKLRTWEVRCTLPLYELPGRRHRVLWVLMPHLQLFVDGGLPKLNVRLRRLLAPL